MTACSIRLTGGDNCGATELAIPRRIARLEPSSSFYLRTIVSVIESWSWVQVNTTRERRARLVIRIDAYSMEKMDFGQNRVFVGRKTDYLGVYYINVMGV